MVARYNADLANNFGNLASRVLNMAVNYLDGVSPEARENGPLRRAVGRRPRAACRAAMARLDFAGGFGAVWDLIRAANAYIEDRGAVGAAEGGDSAAVAAVLGDCLEALRIVALLASPVIPDAAGELWRRLGCPARPRTSGCPTAPPGARCPPGRPSSGAPPSSRGSRG